MVFFNYATMQMAAKIVYYGPGLCGKTTNLHWIYAKTAPMSRGEMVSLETETDRTLFFDLLPLDVGVIGGFKTRLQLYTVPGQVFYNTTRKLVLKGVDGIVFVADLQRAMLDANVESFKNLRENLAEIGVNVAEVPLVLQLNKKDLPNIIEKPVLVSALDPEGKYLTVEAAAVNGEGVFETLKEISKLTLRTLRRRMMGEDAARPAPPVRPSVVQQPTRPREAPVGFNPSPAVAKGPTLPPPPPVPASAAPAVAAVQSPLSQVLHQSESIAEDPFASSADERLLQEAPPMESLLDAGSASMDFPEIQQPLSPPETFEELLGASADERLAAVDTVDYDDEMSPEAAAEIITPPDIAASPEKIAPPAIFTPVEVTPLPPSQPVTAVAAELPVKRVKVRSTADIFAELDSLRRLATQGGKPKPAAPKAPPVVEFQLSADVMRAAKRLQISFLFEDREGNVVQQREARIELESDRDVQNIQIKLKSDRG